MSEGVVPDAVPDRVESGPPGTCFSEIHYYRQLDSTNRYLLDVARRRPQHGLVAVAGHQSAGRGRLGRHWEAPPGANLLVSVLLVPDLPPADLYLCNVAAALSAAEACRQVASLEAELKWPNDLLVGERKLGGILAESVPALENGPPVPGSGGPLLVVGIGVNVRWPPPEGDAEAASVPEELRATATSILRETGRDVSPDDLLAPLLSGLDRRITELADPHGRHRVSADYRRHCRTLGREIRVTLAHEEIQGAALDITPEGHLVVDCGACFVTVVAGDVVHLRER
jgi:BirA family transcriptional regulator, biotin operon repressor / biotin---[acetyl-CoA-carboxylase] ligase